MSEKQEWRFWRDPDSDEWIGVSDALNLNAIGDTLADCAECAQDAMDALARELAEGDS
jgi:hypothetical protein